jgi:excisionase family DNA binding protein
MYLSAAQACGKLGISRWTLARLIKDGQIEAVKGTARNSHLHIPEHSIDAYLTRRKVRSSLAPAGVA